MCLVGGAVAYFTMYAGDSMRDRFEDLAAPVFGFVGGCYDWAREKVSGARSFLSHAQRQ